ncbi:MAG: hypothetical protein QM817_40970 [Archangium sp.]
MRFFAAVVLAASVFLACPGASVIDAGAGGGAAVGGGGGAAGGGGGGGGQMTSDAGVEGIELLGKLSGLWSGPATLTPLGDFPVMNFDLRPVDGQFVFGQTELDASNTLRFGFSIETVSGRDVLAYRNGGFFQGVLRDSRTALVETDGGTWRFCSVPAGCSYIDARFTPTETTLVLDTKVRGMQHVLWNATKQEARTVPSPFPSDLASRGDGGAPWPTLASVDVNVSFGAAVSAPAQVWVLLTTSACFPTFGCHAARSISVPAAMGSTSATMNLPNVHAGAYKVTVLLDADRNFVNTRAPSSGDRVAIDQDLTVPQSGSASVNALTSYTVP